METVVPGEVLAEGMDYLPSFGTYRQKDKIVASRLGLVRVDGRVIKLIPLAGAYLPKKNDRIIAKVSDIAISGWRFDINSAYGAMLSTKEATSEYIRRGADLTRWFNVGDYVVTKITNVTSQNLVDLTMKGRGLKKIVGGRIIKINCTKVPRVIGKKGSMISMIKDKTGCSIIIGQNGFVWIKGKADGELKATKAIKMIEEKSHVKGLTDKVNKFLGSDK
ncbi:MAG: Exosome complex component Rrp4 [Candidatus Woesearchaeota archaeon]|nr:Exosome complex component Rrp4 [Candidatus Woesearchaeota archaeon]